jgi:hypothetical protein
MQGCLVAIIFSVGSVLLLGGLLSYGGNLFGASGAAIGIGAWLLWLQSRRDELTADGRRGAPDRGEYRQAAGATAKASNARFSLVEEQRGLLPRVGSAT